MTASSAIRCNPGLKTVYERLRADDKKHKLAIVAVLRKMLALLGALLRDDRLWMPAPRPSPAAA